jgi:glutathione S-transferase
MDGAGRQTYLAGHDRLAALIHRLDADKRPRDRRATESARLLGVLDQRLADHDWVSGADYSIADSSLPGWMHNLIGFYGARELILFRLVANELAPRKSCNLTLRN